MEYGHAALRAQSTVENAGTREKRRTAQANYHTRAVQEVPPEGLEPSTNGLRVRCSTIELWRQEANYKT